MKPPATKSAPAVREFISVSEAAELAGVHRTTVWKWVRAGVIASFTTPRGRTRVRRVDVVKPRAAPR